MDAIIEFGRGPLFRFSFAVMLLGVGRLFYLAYVARRFALPPVLPLRPPSIRCKWLRPVYGIPAGLIYTLFVLVPLTLPVHVRMWQEALGFAWTPIGQVYSDWFSLAVIVGLPFLAFLRAILPGPKSRKQTAELLWPILLMLPFVSGYAMSNLYLSASAYQALKVIHVLSADTVLLLIPFTTLAASVLEPLTRLVSGHRASESGEAA